MKEARTTEQASKDDETIGIAAYRPNEANNIVREISNN
jgi:hypothetical protein